MKRPAGYTAKGLTRREVLSLGRDVGAGLAASALLPLAGCHHRERMDRPSSVVIAPSLSPIGAGSLRTHATSANLLTGCAVNARDLRSDERYRALVTEQCSIISPENAMKWDALRPSVGVFDFTDADYLIAFAESANLKLRGHCLVWHDALPKWFNGATYRGNAREMMVEHINTVVGRYAGRIHSWDVVNEAVNTYDLRPDGLRKSPWLELIGEDYIEVAFRAARQADPNALLTYNEYGLELDNFESDNKRQQVLLLLRRLKARNVPIDALGIQSHLSAEALTGPTSSYIGVAHFILQVRELGLQIFLTEMDVSDANINGSQRERNRAVASTYNDYLHVMLADAAVKAVLTWGISSRHTWLTKEKPRLDGVSQPLPFDANYDALPAFYAIRDAYDGRPISLAHPADSTVNEYAPFTPRTLTPAEKAERDAKERELEKKSGLPALSAPVQTPASGVPAIPDVTVPK